jgi:hypothetical protein
MAIIPDERVAKAQFYLAGAEPFDTAEFSLHLADTTMDELVSFVQTTLVKLVNGRIVKVKYQKKTVEFPRFVADPEARSYTRWLVRYMGAYGMNASAQIPFANAKVVIPYRTGYNPDDIVMEGPFAELKSFLESRLMYNAYSGWTNARIYGISLSAAFTNNYLKKKEQYEKSSQTK